MIDSDAGATSVMHTTLLRHWRHKPATGIGGNNQGLGIRVRPAHLLRSAHWFLNVFFNMAADTYAKEVTSHRFGLFTSPPTWRRTRLLWETMSYRKDP